LSPWFFFGREREKGWRKKGRVLFSSHPGKKKLQKVDSSSSLFSLLPSLSLSPPFSFLSSLTDP
jgi:hypothetical protein